MEDEESGVISVREFLNRRLALVRDDYFSRNKNVREAIKQDLNLPDAAFSKLENMCNPKLMNPDECQAKIKCTEDLDSTHLSTIEFIKNKSTQPSKRNYPVEVKFMKNLAKLCELEPTPEDRIHTPDVIMTIQISNPLVSKSKKLMCSEEFLVLGQTFLYQLKDKICCFRDEIKVGEFSEDPDQVKTAPTLKELMKSGYFLIENKIYNDLRDGCVDCSEPVITWSKGLGLNFEPKNMEEARFIDLNIRMGYPYLYNHLGNCQHLIVFSSLKLVNPSSDCYCISKYPIVKEKHRGRFTFCWCCNTLYAKWIVRDSIYSVDDPTFLCERCLRNSHYVVEGETSPPETPTKTGNKNSENETEQENATKTTDTDNEKINEQTNKLKKVCDFKAYHYSQI